MTVAGLAVAAAAGSLASSVVLPRVGPAAGAGPRRLVPLAAAAAALAAALAPAAPTGSALVDVAGRAALAGGAALLAAWAPAWAVAVAAAVVLAGGGPLAWLAAAGLGLAVGEAVARAGAPLAPLGRTVAAGLVAQAALRLDWPRSSLATAALAAAAVVVVGVAGAVRLPPRPRRALARAGVVVGGLAVVAGGAGAVSVLAARPAVERGIVDATAGLDAAAAGDEARASRLLAAAARSLATGRSRLDAWWARPARAVPVAAQQARALARVASSGSAASAAAARTLAAVDRAGLAVSGGALPVERFASLRAPVSEARAVLAAEGRRLDAVDSPWLLAPVARRLERLSERVAASRASLGQALVAFDVVPPLLGADGARRWFLAVQTPSETRASGGFIGNFAEITADRGRLRMERLGRTAELNEGGGAGGAGRRELDAPPDYTARYGRFEVDRLWQNVTMSPDFPTVARAIAGLYPQSGGRPVDGVVAVDPIGLAALLGVTGPVAVAGWPVPLSAGNAADVLLYEQYVRLESRDEREVFLGRVVEAVWQRLTTSTPSVVALARALGPAVAEKHLVVAATRGGPEAAALRRLGVSGGMAPVRGDFLGVVTQNANGNKVDWFLRRSVDYRARLDPATGAVRSTVRVTLRNRAPAGGLPPVLIESAARPPPPPGANRLYLSVYTPLGLAGARVDGAERLMESELERDRHVYSTYVLVPPGGSATVELELAGEVAAARSGRYRLDLHRQAFLAPDAVTAAVAVPDGWEVARPRARLALVRDRRVETAVRRA